MSNADTPAVAMLAGLNNAQRRAVTSDVATVAILAGPGSGKTHTLTSRVIWLVQQKGLRPGDIIVATFTVKASREMKERIHKALGEEVAKRIVLGTFHSIARRYLAKYGSRIGLDPKFGIADGDDSKAILQRICKRLSLNIEPLHARAWISKKKAKGTTAVPLKNGKPVPENPSMLRCFQEYQDYLARSNLLDYDDLLIRCVEMLKEHPRCVSNVQAVLIDEYQDTNGIQYDLMRLFAQEQKRITIVGDPDQSIYGWRSAEIRNLHRFLGDFPNTGEISLEENYRSSRSILDISLAIIQQDKRRYQKALLPVHKKGARPVLRKLRTSATEGEWIVTEVRRVLMLFGGMLRLDDFSILLRSASLSRHVESALGKAGIAYQMIGGLKFYDRKEIKILLDYLRLVHQPDNNDALARVINVPPRGIGDVTLKSLLEEAEKAKISLWQLLCRHFRGGRKARTTIRAAAEQKLSAQFLCTVTGLRNKARVISGGNGTSLCDILEDLVRQLDFQNYLQEKHEDDHEQRWTNVQELFTMAGDFERGLGHTDEDGLPDIEGIEQQAESDILGRFLANVALASDAQKDVAEEARKPVVTISTIHAAKGLEWPVVFVPSIYTGSIPHSRAEDLDEERRLLYVAMTRAQALLYLSYPMHASSHGTGNKVELSPFVAPFAAQFAQKGPSVDRGIVEDAGKILCKPIPTAQAIFNNLPPLFATEDDLFPLEPFDPNDPDGLEQGSEHRFTNASKRQRTGNWEQIDEGESEAFSTTGKLRYSTTMDNSAHFTMASLPGFVSAGAHKSTLEAAAMAANASRGDMAKGVPKRARDRAPRRPADQQSLLGFVTSSNKHSAESEGLELPPRASSLAFSTNTATEQRHHAIDPALAHHRLKVPPVSVKRAVTAQHHDNSKRQYPRFSSSPPRAKPPAETKEPVAPARPAVSVHLTTFAAAKARARGVRRPVGIGPAPSMDRLRRPFKPLTMNRPVRPTE